MDVFNRNSLALLAFLLSGVVHAESLQSYAQQCIDELQLQSIPAFSCFDGVYTPRVDQNAYIGRLETGNKKAQAVYLCRGASSPADTDFLVGLIIQNIDNGKTCFFDTKLSARDPSRVPSVASASADQFWKTPDEMVSSEPRLSHCHKCHNNDAFLINDTVLDTMAHLDLLNTDRPLISTPEAPVMKIIGQAFNDDSWNDDLMPTPGFSGCTGCHQSSNGPLYAGRSSQMPPVPTSKYLQKPLPKLDDAEVSALGGTGSSLQWRNSGEFPWMHRIGTTPSVGTGPSSGSSGSNGYYYVETSSGYANRFGDTAVLESDFFNPNNAYFTFDVNLHGQDVGSIYVDIWEPSTFQWRESVWSLDGQTYAGNDKPDFWLSRLVDLEEFDTNGQSIKIRVRVVANGGYRGDIAIDRLLISRKLPVAIRNRADDSCLKIYGFNGPTASGSDNLVACNENEMSQQLFSWDMGNEKVRLGGDWTRNTGTTTDYCWYMKNDELQVQSCNPYFSTARQDYLWEVNHLPNGYSQFVSDADPAQCMSFSQNSDGSKSASLDICNPNDTKQQWQVTRKEKRL